MRPRDVAQAYDAIAATYDEQVQGDAWMRHVLWRHFLQTFEPGDRVLDVACGTGVDAVFLAQRGIQMIGIDASPRMIDELQRKVRARGLADRIDAGVMDVAQLGSLPAGHFDGIISSFAGLSAEPDLAPFAAVAAELLRPDGRMILHLLGRFSPWEWLGLVARGKWRAARALRTQTERTFPIGGRPIRHYLHEPDEVYQRFFADAFSWRRAYSLGCLRPPHTSRRVPSAIGSILGGIERRVAAYPPFLNWGRFFVLELRRKAPSDAGGPGGRG